MPCEDAFSIVISTAVHQHSQRILCSPRRHTAMLHSTVVGKEAQWLCCRRITVDRLEWALWQLLGSRAGADDPLLAPITHQDRLSLCVGVQTLLDVAFCNAAEKPVLKRKGVLISKASVCAQVFGQIQGSVWHLFHTDSGKPLTSSSYTQSRCSIVAMCISKPSDFISRAVGTYEAQRSKAAEDFSLTIGSIDMSLLLD